MTDSDEIARNLAEYMIYLTNPSSYQEGDMDEDDGDDEGDILRTDLWASKDPRARLPGPKEKPLRSVEGKCLSNQQYLKNHPLSI